MGFLYTGAFICADETTHGDGVGFGLLHALIVVGELVLVQLDLAEHAVVGLAGHPLGADVAIGATGLLAEVGVLLVVLADVLAVPVALGAADGAGLERGLVAAVVADLMTGRDDHGSTIAQMTMTVEKTAAASAK